MIADLAYYQWYSACSYAFIQRNRLSISAVLSLYSTLHEAELSKFVQTADVHILRHLNTRKSRLKTIRKQSHFTQEELAELSLVTLRMIQTYEQCDKNILKTETKTVFVLSKALDVRQR